MRNEIRMRTSERAVEDMERQRQIKCEGDRTGQRRARETYWLQYAQSPAGVRGSG